MKNQELSNMNYNDALDLMNNLEGAKLEHLLKLDVFYCENEKTLLEWLPVFTHAAWSYFGITVAYNGYGTHKDKNDITEIFFRTNRPITEDEFREIENCTSYAKDSSICLWGVEHKTMIVDDLEEIYEDLDYHWSINSYQSLYEFTDEEMMDIFGDDWELFSEEATK